MQREKKKMKSGSAAGKQDQQVKKCDWKHWDALMFLLPNYTLEPTESNLDIEKKKLLTENATLQLENLTQQPKNLDPQSSGSQKAQKEKKKFSKKAVDIFPLSDANDDRPIVLFQKRAHKTAFDEEMLYHPDYEVEFPKKKPKMTENNLIASSVESINNTCKLLSSSIRGTMQPTQPLQPTSTQNVQHDDLEAFSRLIFSELKQLKRFDQLTLKKAILDLVSSFTLDLVTEF